MRILPETGFICLNPTPDLVIEVLMTSSAIDKLKVYKGLNVSEVWFWEGQFSIYQLQSPSAGYQPISRSTFFPELDLALLATYVQPMAAPQAVRAFRYATRVSPVVSAELTTQHS